MRRVFFSFHYENDNWRVSQVREIGVVEGNPVALDNEWEEVKSDGAAAIKKWIDDNLKNRSCTIVLVGEETAGRKWINYEIKKSWEDGKGVIGIYIHGLKDQYKHISKKGKNPFDDFTLGEGYDKKKLSEVVKCYDPKGTNSQDRYDWIKENLEDKIEEAIKIRSDHKGWMIKKD